MMRNGCEEQLSLAGSCVASKRPLTALQRKEVIQWTESGRTDVWQHDGQTDVVQISTRSEWDD
jgi:hypothetical protein